MNIKSLLLGSAAALAVVSGAQAADAIVAAEPEAVEYVKVCDAYGTGYFYIPGTETCLKIGGYLRFDVGFGAGDAYDGNNEDDWAAHTRSHVTFTAKSDTEYGTLTSGIVLETNYRGTDTGGDSAVSPTVGNSTTLGGAGNGTAIDEAFISIAGVTVGKFANWWDNDFSGETDVLATLHGTTKPNAIRYQYDGGSFYAGASLEELTETNNAGGTGGGNLGIDAAVGGKFDAFTWEVLGSYDSDAQEGAVRVKLGADVGPGTFEIAGIYSSGYNNYYDAGKWSVAAQYALKATDKLTITPGAQYIDDIQTGGALGDDFDGGHEWRAGLTLNYKIVENLSTELTATYVNDKFDDGRPDASYTEGFFRLQRDF